MRTSAGNGNLPLAGVRVLTLENFVAGPLATMLLADWGADVVKIEPPGGDAYRSFPPIESTDAGTSSVSFVRLNRGKRSVVVDVASEAGRNRVLELVDKADVVVQNLRSGGLAKLGLGYDVLVEHNPQIILVSISGFGQPDVQPGPYTSMPAFDLIGQAMSGLTYTTGSEGDPPAPIGFPLIDTTAADWAASAVLLALFQRERTGRGQHVDVAMYDVALHLNEYGIGAYGWSGSAAARGRLPTSAPFELVKTSDGHVAIAVSGQPIFERFCAAIERPELAQDPRLSDGIRRSAAMDEILLPAIEAWTTVRTVEDVLTVFGEHGVPASRVQTITDVFACPQAEARQMIVSVPDSVLGTVRTAGNPLKGTAFPPLVPRPAPQLGAHTRDVFDEWLSESAEREE